jgi:hypothetical protein
MANALKPISVIELTADENKMLKWLKRSQWEPQKDKHEPIPYKTKVPEFYDGVRLYKMQGSAGGGSLGLLELFIKKLQHNGIIGKQDIYPLAGHGTARTLSLKKADMDNLGVGKTEEEDEE